MLSQQLLVHVRTFIETFRKGLRDEDHEVLVPFVIFSEQDEARSRADRLAALGALRHVKT